VGSGLFDTIGLFRKLSPHQDELVRQWLELMGLKEELERPLKLLSLGGQRMVLLARALVKNPPLLILDEPCQGLDGQQAHYFNSLVSALCHHFGTTLIYVSHYTEAVPACIDQHIRLEGGRRVV
jgi:molybdate transport system ATP-binding protein